MQADLSRCVLVYCTSNLWKIFTVFIKTDWNSSSFSADTYTSSNHAFHQRAIVKPKSEFSFLYLLVWVPGKGEWRRKWGGKGAGRKQSGKVGWESGVTRSWEGEDLGSDGLHSPTLAELLPPSEVLLSILLIKGILWVVSPLESLLWLR